MALSRPGEETGAGQAGDGAARDDGRPATAASVPVDWEALAWAMAHPLQISILEVLGIDGGRTMSPNELSLELQVPLSRTNYHVGRLARAGLIVVVGERGVRGAVEHFYRLAPRGPGAARPRPPVPTGEVCGGPQP